ncbi:NADP-dependent oxidoreductase [Salinactinospora qingdaonensis]|uniref:NADP-dependent oxidoreductase n=1 Tax=Salinactinospora qingdaonensis TaxID=702744 RepID=A0ABP7GKD6_9ACTN
MLVRVEAAGVGFWDAMSREGRFGEMDFPYVPGFETAGVVESTGAKVTGLAVGDEVYAFDFPGGGYAEYRAISAATAVRKPASLSFAEAAAIPVAGITAHQGILDVLGLREDETVLVTAAAGGVGTFAVQIASAVAGARVVGTATPANHDYLAELGAAAAVDYRDDAWPRAVREAAGGAVDAVLDCAGGEVNPQILSRAFETVRDGGRVAYLPSLADEPLPENEPAPPRGISARFFGAEPDAERLARLAELFDAGTLTVHLEEVIALEEAARAQERVEAGHTRGKLVLGVGPRA